MTRTPRRVVVSARSFDETAASYLRESGCEVDHIPLPPGSNDGSLDTEALAERLDGAEGWIVGHAHVTSALLARLPHLKIIARAGVGYERVDLEAARKAGMVVTIAAGGNDSSVADHTIGLMLAVLRRLRESRINMENGNWTILTSADLHLKTVGIIGLGRVGQSVIRRLKGFDAHVLVNSRSPDPEYAAVNGLSFVDLETLLRESDIVSIHAPLTPATRFLLDAEAFSRMKKTAILINVGRGGLVDDRSLLDALVEKRIAGAGLDVFVSESDPAFKPVTEKLLALANVVATPHSAASSAEGLARTNLLAARAVMTVLEGGQPPAGQVVADGRTLLEKSGA